MLLFGILLNSDSIHSENKNNYYEKYCYADQ